METPPRLARVADLALELLLDGHSPAERDERLLDVAWRAGLAPAMALWRRAEDALPGDGQRWFPIRARGPAELLPLDRLVRASLEGGVDGDLPGCSIIVGWDDQPRTALVLAAGGNEAALEIGAALLTLAALVGAPRSAEELFDAPLPGPEADAADDESDRRSDAN